MLSKSVSFRRFPIGSKIRNEVISKVAEQIFKAVIYTIKTLLMYILLKQGPFIDYGLMGGVERVDMFKNYPCIQTPKYMNDVYIIMFGYHFYELIFVCLFNREKKDFSVMLLHHIATISLILISFSVNFLLPGSIILLLHDFSDILVCITRIA